MKEVIVSGIFLVVICMLAPQKARSQGTLYLSNLGQPSAGSASVGSDSWQAALFKTGNNPGGYAVDSVQLAMTPASGSPSGFTVMLYSKDTTPPLLGLEPGASLGTLSGSSTDPVTGGIYAYTASGLTLSPSSDYFIVLTAGTTVASGAYAWSFETSAPPSSSEGWEGGNVLFQSSDGSAWTQISGAPQFALTATAVPEPETLYLMGWPALLFFAWRRWRAKAQAP